MLQTSNRMLNGIRADFASWWVKADPHVISYRAGHGAVHGPLEPKPSKLNCQQAHLIKNMMKGARHFDGAQNMEAWTMYNVPPWASSGIDQHRTLSAGSGARLLMRCACCTVYLARSRRQWVVRRPKASTIT